MQHYEIRQFDKVKLRTTRNIKYLSDMPNSMPSPHGIWSVVGNVGRDLLIAKGTAMCCVPVRDVMIVGRSKVDHIRGQIDGKKERRKNAESKEVRNSGRVD